jgi:hypothetical protein
MLIFMDWGGKQGRFVKIIDNSVKSYSKRSCFPPTRNLNYPVIPDTFKFFCTPAINDKRMTDIL